MRRMTKRLDVEEREDMSKRKYGGYEEEGMWYVCGGYEEEGM